MKDFKEARVWVIDTWMVKLDKCDKFYGFFQTFLLEGEKNNLHKIDSGYNRLLYLLWQVNGKYSYKIFEMFKIDAAVQETANTSKHDIHLESLREIDVGNFIGFCGRHLRHYVLPRSNVTIKVEDGTKRVMARLTCNKKDKDVLIERLKTLAKQTRQRRDEHEECVSTYVSFHINLQ